MTDGQGSSVTWAWQSEKHNRRRWNQGRANILASYDLYDRILGCVATAAMGDALGAPTEAMSRADIISGYGGYVREFYKPGASSYAEGNEPGEVTDDSTQLYEMARALVETDGDLTVEAAAKALLKWSEYEKFYPRNAGPTTQYVIEELKQGKDPVEVGLAGGTYGRGTSNGAAMRVAPAGLVNPGNLDGAVKTAITMCAPSHANQIAYSGAAAIACGIAEAITEKADVFSVIRACMYGARAAEHYGLEHARIAAGCRVVPRVGQAVRIAIEAETLDQLLAELEGQIGNDGEISSTVPTAIGLFAFAGGDPFDTIVAGANIGNDTDTIACIAGALAGALSGFARVPQDKYEYLKTANAYLDFEGISRQMADIASRRLKV